MNRRALIIVDVQNDFVSGSLALDKCPAQQDGNSVIPVINNITKNPDLIGFFDAIVFTQDWHPCNHCSFINNIKISNLDPTVKIDIDNVKPFDEVRLIYPPLEKSFEQIMWPPHCIQDTWGAELCSALEEPSFTYCKEIFNVKKGCDKDIDCYSAFFSNERIIPTNLSNILIKYDISKVFICGLALDVCVYHTAIDADFLGFETYVIEDACRGVDEKKINEAIADMKINGIRIIKSKELPK